MAKNYFFEVNDVKKEGYELSDRVDPDSKNKGLYEDFISLFFTDILPNGEFIKVEKIVERQKNEKSWWEAIVDDGMCRIGLGMDYIGPSIWWAQKAGLEDYEILRFVNDSREIGGHLIWPRWISDDGKYIDPFYSINTIRGGQKGVFDRIDFTLLYLKLWYENKDNPFFRAFESNKIWLEKFVNFKKFISFFKLDGFVNIGDEIMIKNLSSFDCEYKKYEKLQDNSKAFIPDSKEEYERYIEGCNYIINARTRTIVLS